MKHPNPEISLFPSRTYGAAIEYDVHLLGVWIGVVGRKHAEKGWFFRNDAAGWYGTVPYRDRAVDSLVELASR